MMREAQTRFIAVFIIIGALIMCANASRAHAMQVAEFGDAGFLNIDYQLQLRWAQRNIGSGPTGDDSTSDVYVRRNRLSFLGALNETVSFAVQFEYNGGRKITETGVLNKEIDYEFTVLDAYVSIDLLDSLKFRAGKTKHVLTREVNEGCFDPLSADRSSFVEGPFEDRRTRDNGVVAWGNLVNDLFQYRLAVMEGNRSSLAPKSSYRYTGRAHVSLLDPETGHGYKGTYLGKKKVLTFGAGYEVEPDAVYSDNLTGTATGAEDYTGLTYDVFFEYPTEFGTYTVSGAYLKTDFNHAGLRGVKDAQGYRGEKNGNYAKAGYLIGKVQVFGRLEKWSFANLDGVYGQEMDLTAYGANYYFKGQDLRLTLEYTSNDLKDNSLSKDFNTIMAQLQLKF